MGYTKKEDGFEMLARLIKEETEDVYTNLTNDLTKLIKQESEDIRSELRSEIGKLERKVDEGFVYIDRRLDNIIQPQLDDHAHRIKTLETLVI